jgi:hypothetical protein
MCNEIIAGVDLRWLIPKCPEHFYNQVWALAGVKVQIRDEEIGPNAVAILVAWREYLS